MFRFGFHSSTAQHAHSHAFFYCRAPHVVSQKLTTFLQKSPITQREPLFKG